MFRILDRYIGKTVFHFIMMTLFILILLSGIIKFVEQLRKVGQGSYSAMGGGLYTFLSIPKDIEVFFPMAVLLGALRGLGELVVCRELVVMHASGFSRLQVAGSVMKTAIPLVLFTMVIGEWVSPFSEEIARNYRTKMLYGGSMLSIQNGLWVKDGNDFIFIEQVMGKKKLSGVSIYHFDQAERLHILSSANSATFSNGRWTLSQVDEADFSDCMEIIGKQILNREWKSSLTPDKLGVVVLAQENLSISGLHNYVKYLKESGQESRRYQLHMWSKIFLPFSVAIMMLIAISFMFGPLRSVAIGGCILTGISVGFLFYVIDQICGPLSLLYNVPPVFGALFPGIIFLVISIVILLKYK